MQTEIGRYRLVRHLATGGMGEVYLAEAPGAHGFAKRVVVKTLRQDLASDQELVRQFIAEGQLLEALDHPNIAAILDLGQDGDGYFLAMEFVEGFDLRAVQRALPMTEHGQTLSEIAVLEIVRAVAQALDHAQTRRGPDGKPLGIVHHDVTPSNVMVRRDGHVKLVDFGVARTALVARLSAGALRGKLPYLSPEHARQERADGRSDLFSLGLCALEWLSGQRALDVSDPESLNAAYATLPGKLATLEGRVKAETLQLLQDLTQLDRKQRPTTAAEVADRANRLLAEAGELSPARRLAAELAPAFEVLAARAGSFDQTLAQTIGMLGNAPVEFTGTLSLPGIEVVQQSRASVQSAVDAGALAAEPKHRAPSRWTLLLGLVVLGLALWIWQSREDNDAAFVPPRVVASRLPAQVPPVEPVAVLPVTPTPAVLAVVAPLAPTPEVPAAPQQPERHGRQPTPEGKPQPLEAKSQTQSSQTQPSQPQWGTVEFRVLPASTVIMVDGKQRQPSSGGDHYILQLKPGKHTIVARDPDDSAAAQTTALELAPGEYQKLKGFSFLP
jgi:tRNA A-37 threonylcarbamoyl transferase component Bud32